MTLKKMTTKTMIALFMTAMLVLMTVTPVFAADHPILDLDQKGSITLTHEAKKTGKPIKGSTMVLYKVADAVYDDGNAIFQPIDELDSASMKEAMNGVSEADAGAMDLAKKVQKLVKSAGISGDKKVTNGAGQAKWENLDVGMYLIVNTHPGKGYNKIPPFLITVPRLIDGKYVYDVVSEPKPDPAPTTTTTTKQTTTDKHLPQTGQTWWPVPVLCLLGIVLVGIGVYRKKHS